MTNNTGLSLLKTWLHAVNIPFAAEKDILVAQGATGNIVQIVVGRDVGRDVSSTSTAIVIEGSDLTGRKIPRALEVFAELQKKLGYEPRTPVDRGEVPTKKLANGSDFELVAFRHGEFRRCPNPTPTKLEAYKVTIERAVWRFMRSNSRLCADNLLAIDDLRTYAQVWTVNYCGLYELDSEAVDKKDQNEKLLYAHLTQRFSNFRALLIDKSRNVHPMLDTAFIGLHGRPYDYNDFSAWESTTDEVAEESAEDDDRVDLPARRIIASVRLDDALEEMGHDQMVSVLTGAAKNDRIHPDARAEASRRLDEHKAGCTACTEVEYHDENEDPEAMPSFYSVKVDVDDEEG